MRLPVHSDDRLLRFSRTAVFLLLLSGFGPAPALAWNWRHAGVDSAGSNLGQFVGMKADTKGRLHGAYYKFDNNSEGNRNLKYTTNTSPSGNGPWQTVTVDNTASTGSYSSLALTSNNVPHISYYDSQNANLRHAWYDSTAGAWLKETVDSPGTVGQFSAMAVDTVSNTLYIAYFDASTPGLKVARKAPGQLWTFEFADTAGVVGLYNSIIVNGNVQIAYYDLSRRNLKFAERIGNSWTTVTVDSVGDVGRNASIAGDPDHVWISYYDVSFHRLRFAERSGGSWTVRTLDQTGDVGAGTAMAVGPGLRPAVVYYDVTNLDLKYAERIQGTWLFSTIATGGNVGRYAGLAVPEDNLPNTLYFDETQGKLRFAHGTGETTGTPEPARPPEPPRMQLAVRTNPTWAPVVLDFTARAEGRCSLRVFDIRGRFVADLFDGPVEAGVRSFTWGGADVSGRPVPSGVYFVRASSAVAAATARFVLVR